MRSISGLYFLLRPAVYLLAKLPYFLNDYININKWFIFGALFCTISLFIAFAKPYKKCFMNFLDAILFFYFTIFSFLLSIRWPDVNTVVIARILLSTPIILFLLIITFKKIYSTVVQLYKVCKNNLQLPRTVTWFGGTAFTAETMGDQNSYDESQTAAKPLMQPTSTVISYGADDNEAPVL